MDVNTQAIQTQALNLAYEEQKISLLSFSQALAAWDSTEDDVIEKILECLNDTGNLYESLPNSPAQMLEWPWLTEDMLHPAALEFYKKEGVI